MAFKSLIKHHLHRCKQESLRLALILVGYSPKDTVYSLGTINLLAEILDIEHKVLVWNNHVVPSDIDALVHNDWSVQPGTNKNHEFSGWQEGLAILPNTSSYYDFVIFANDSLARFSSDTRRSRLVSSLAQAIERGAQAIAIGLIHYPSNQSGYLEIQGIRISSWLCTGFFALPGKYIDKLNQEIDNSSAIKPYISPTGNNFLSDTCPVITKLYIHRWLTDVENGWYGAMPLPHSEQDLALLRDKAKMILNELSLSARLAQAGFLFYDPTVREISLKSNFFVSLFRRFCLLMSRVLLKNLRATR